MTGFSRAARGPALGALAASLVLSPLALAGPAGAVDAPAAEHYVAFGDSFVSGPGIPEQWGGGCARSTKNFPAVVARTLAVDSFVDVSCAGATTAHFTAAQGDNAPQLDALSAETTLVTFGTMGGNDVGLIGLAMDCVSSDCVPGDGADPLAAKFAQVRTDLTSALAETQRRSPHADVMVVGYGTYMPAGGCPAQFANLLTSAEFDYVQDQIDRLSDLLRDVAGEAGVHFVDQREIPGASDHTVCSTEADQWIRGYVPAGQAVDGSTFHPSSAGMAATGAFVVQQVAEMRDRGEHPTPVPPGPTDAEVKAARLAALKTKAKSVTVSASCHGSAKKGTVRLRVRGGSGAVAKVEFRAGKKRVTVDRKSPFTVTKKSAALRKALKKKSSKVSAKVTLKDGSLSVSRTVALKKRPRCLR